MINLPELFLLSLILVLVNLFLLKKNILIDVPNIDKHKRKIFFSKKVPKSLGLILLMSILYKFEYNIYERLSIFLIFYLGIQSDIKKINSPKVRFIIQAIIILLFSIYSKNFIIDTRIPFIDYMLQYKLFKLMLTLFCVLIIINGSNFIDGLNTLCLGYYLNILLILYFLNFDLIAQIDSINYLISIMGILFLFNFFGKSFLGDGGSYLLGFFFSIILIKLHIQNSEISPWFFAILLWYPAFEILFSIIRRSYQKKNAFLADNAHFHQLLYLYYKKKYNLNTPFLNPMIANLINFFNLIIFLIALKYNTQTILMINIFIFNCLVYLGIYFLLTKSFSKSKFNKK
jgi:UDP-N-acetylmuramyl pentapeptide phosphotransferase/UDP-N-acetylglucosamine-1-phosphate transferase